MQNTAVTSQGITHLVETCTELKSLALRFNNNLRTITLEKNFTNLHSFELFSPGEIVTEQIIHCTKLEQLYFSGIRTSLNVTPRTIGKIVAPLKCLAVRNAMLPSDYLVAILSDTFAPTLTMLDLSYCKTVADWPLVLKNHLVK